MLNKVYQKNKNLPWQSIDGETIIIDPVKRSSFELQEVGSFIWGQVDGEKSFGQICESVCSEYDVDAGDAQKDLEELFESLLESKLISLAI